MFENYTASFEVDTLRVELSLWDTSGKRRKNNLMLFLSKPRSTHMHIAYEFIGLHRSCNAVFEILGVVGYDDMTPSIFGGLETG